MERLKHDLSVLIMWERLKSESKRRKMMRVPEQRNKLNCQKIVKQKLLAKQN